MSKVLRDLAISKNGAMEMIADHVQRKCIVC